MLAHETGIAGRSRCKDLARVGCAGLACRAAGVGFRLRRRSMGASERKDLQSK